MTTPSEVASIAATLTKAQREALTTRAKHCANDMNLPPEWHTFQRSPLHERLVAAGFVGIADGRLTPLGQSVRALLTQPEPASMTTEAPESRSDAAAEHVPGVGDLIAVSSLQYSYQQSDTDGYMAVMEIGPKVMDELWPELVELGLPLNEDDDFNSHCIVSSGIDGAVLRALDLTETRRLAFKAGARDMRERAAVECNEMRLSLYLLGRDASAQVAEKLVDMIDALPLTKDDR